MLAHSKYQLCLARTGIPLRNVEMSVILDLARFLKMFMEFGFSSLLLLTGLDGHALWEYHQVKGSLMNRMVISPMDQPNDELAGVEPVFLPFFVPVVRWTHSHRWNHAGICSNWHAQCLKLLSGRQTGPWTLKKARCESLFLSVY